jgi:hypothetical protein
MHPGRLLLTMIMVAAEAAYPRRADRGVCIEATNIASPISDFEDLYSDEEDPPPRRRMNPGEPRPRNSHKRNKESDDDEPEPWNAVCIVGLRVYSKDEGLDIMVYEENDAEDLVKLKEVKEEGTGADGSVENLVKSEEVKEDNAGIDGDVEDSGDEESKKRNVVKKPKDKPETDQGESDIMTTKDTEGEKVPRPDAVSMDNQPAEDAEKRLTFDKEESALSIDGGAAILENLRNIKIWR